MLTDNDIREIMNDPDISKDAAEVIRTIVHAFADLLIQHQEDQLDAEEAAA